jgi:hypothetical protein
VLLNLIESALQRAVAAPQAYKTKFDEVGGLLTAS